MNNLKAKVICAGNCPVCNKPLKNGECIFMCNECKIKNEIFMELEKIKEEIKDLDLGFFDEDYRAGIARGIMEFNKILNKHISELKGENNA